MSEEMSGSGVEYTSLRVNISITNKKLLNICFILYLRTKINEICNENYQNTVKRVNNQIERSNFDF